MQIKDERTPLIAQNDDNYEMSDHASSSEEESEEDEDNSKKVPAWARGEALQQALHKQYKSDTVLDPDAIFHTSELSTCNLEEIFKVNSRILLCFDN